MFIVGYPRLSRDEDKENYTSIEGQIEIINECSIKMFGRKVDRLFIDDNKSGYIFDRPAFNEMRKELSEGNIDVIIAKDLSRIGRHNAKTLLFLEELQLMGARVILPEEGSGYDSDSDDDDIIGIKTWYNERYVRDISRKVRAGLGIRQKRGELVMGNLYGYIKKDPYIRHKLTVDEEVRHVIELIFKLYLEGLGYKKICDILNEKGYPTPSMNTKQKHADAGRVFKNKVSDVWQTHNIQRIITNPMYVGTLVTHKKTSKTIKGKQGRVPKEEQYLFENHHEPIISKEDFELAQQINAKRAGEKEQSGIGNAVYKNTAKHNYIFSSFVFCGDCGFSATGKNLAKRPRVTLGYECVQYAKYGLNRCVSHNIWEDRLLHDFKEFLRDVKAQYEDYIKAFNFEESRKNVKDALSKVQKELDIANEELKLLLNQKIRDLMKESSTEYRDIVEESYSQLENDKKAKIKELSQKVDELKKVSNKDIEDRLKTAIGIFDSIIDAERPNRKDLELVLDKILIYGDKSIEFKLLVNIDELTYSNNIANTY
jgi:site-specific DNA recombinase